MSESKSAGTGGITVVGGLGILFVGLKLGGVIDWSWWWVTCPFWIGPLVALAFFAIAGLVIGIASLVTR